jgi:hypothetical protein
VSDCEELGDASIGCSDTKKQRNGELIFRSFGRLTPFHLGIMKRYLAQLIGSGIRLSLLHDSSSDPLYAPEYDLMQNSLDEVPVCRVSWPQVVKEYPLALSSIPTACKHEGEGFCPCQNLQQCYDDAFLALWWTRCAGQRGVRPKHVWIVEDDAFFSGDISRFIRQYDSDDYDMIAPGFRIASPRWWPHQLHMFDNAMKHGLRSFNRSVPIVTNLDALPYMLEPPCADEYLLTSEVADVGLVFAQANVMRLSNRLLETLTSSWKRGVIGKTEAFLATLCASQIGFETQQKCSMLDFAPVALRNIGQTPVSPLFCWEDVGGWGWDYTSDFMVDAHAHCSDSLWKHKWIHPVKTDKLEDLECSSLTSLKLRKIAGLGWSLQHRFALFRWATSTWVSSCFGVQHVAQWLLFCIAVMIVRRMALSYPPRLQNCPSYHP